MAILVITFLLRFQDPSWYAPSGIAIDGYDPVSYFSGASLEGSANFTATYEGVIFYFSSAQNREKFTADPRKYLPQYGGWCAYAMGDSGEKVKVDPETFTITNGKLYLFYNFWGNNTLKPWKVSEMELIRKADDHWKKFTNQE